jgi:hypothetical protein
MVIAIVKGRKTNREEREMVKVYHHVIGEISCGGIFSSPKGKKFHSLFLAHEAIGGEGQYQFPFTWTGKRVQGQDKTSWFQLEINPGWEVLKR